MARVEKKDRSKIKGSIISFVVKQKYICRSSGLKSFTYQVSINYREPLCVPSFLIAVPRNFDIRTTPLLMAVHLPPMHELQMLKMLILRTRNEESLCVCIFFRRWIQVIAIYIMELQPPILSQASNATSEELILAVNVFVGIQGYTLVKKRTKKSKKEVLQKEVLMFDRSNANVDERIFARDTTSRKCDCCFDAVALTENNVWVLRVQVACNDHKPTLAGAHPTHSKSILTRDVQQQISHHAQVGQPPKQTLSILRLDNKKENPLFKLRKVYNIRQKSEKKT